MFSLNATTVPVIEWRQQAYSGFIQDDWKVTPNLTVNLGLRYEYATPYYGAGENQNVNFDFRRASWCIPTGDDKYLMDTDRNNFAPRLGLAWQAVPERLVVRGGYGVFYSIEDMRGSEGHHRAQPAGARGRDAAARRQHGAAAPPPVGPVPGRRCSTNYDPSHRRREGAGARPAGGHGLSVECRDRVPAALAVHLRGGLRRQPRRNLLANVPVNTVPFGVDGSVAANRPFPGWHQIDVQHHRGTVGLPRAPAEVREAAVGRVLRAGVVHLADAEDEIGAWGAGGNGVQAILAPDYSNIDEALRGERGPNGQIPRHRFTFTEVWQVPIGRGRAVGRRT